MERFWDFNIKKEVKLFPLFFNESLRGIAIILIDLFSPIFIYKTLFSLTGQFKTAILAVILFYFGVYVLKFIGNLLAEELSLRYGLKRQLHLGNIFKVLSVSSLFFSIGNPLFLIFASVFEGLASGFYWFGRHGLIAKIGEERSFGKELGINSIIGTSFFLATPFLGGLLISVAGYPAMFAGSLFFVLAGTFFLSSLREEKTVHDTDLSEVIKLFFRHKRDFFAYFGEAAAGAIGLMVFPLYLYLILGKELSLGEFVSLTAIFAAFINVLVGRWTDVKGKRGLIKIGSIITSLVWVCRAMTKSVPLLLVLSVVNQLSAGMTGIPLSVLSYEKAVDGHATGRAILFRETAICLGGITACLLAAIAIFWGFGLESALLLAALFSLFPLFVVRGARNE